METALFELCSPLHKEAKTPAQQDPFVQEVEAALGQKFIHCGQNFESYGKHDIDIIYVRTGGTEGLYRAQNLSAPHTRLLTSGLSNSLAASMEILASLRAAGKSGEILHGTAEQIAQAITNPQAANSQDATRYIQPMPNVDLGGMRLGVIGKPSDWLIASNVYYAKAKEKFNVDLVDIPIEELIERIKQNANGADLRSFKGSEIVYDSIKEIISKYKLRGITLRCFDLLDTVHNTGCLALARLNAEGIPSSCEGDIPALLTMAVTLKQHGTAGFQCNLSKISGQNLLFAHCTIPLNMVESYTYATHFESGIGTAIKGELPLRAVTIFKIAPSLENCVKIPGTITANSALPNLCRTQITVNVAPGAEAYFLRESLANHHIIY